MVGATTPTLERTASLLIMDRLIRLHEDATIDLEDHVNYIAQTDRDRAFQLFDAARQTFTALATMPGMGRVYESENDGITGLRKWAVKGFKQYLIFYRYDDETIEVLRVLNAARDLDPLLKDL
jgi:toxin ParE1/3/4